MVVLNGNVTPSHEQVEEEDLGCIDCVVTGGGMWREQVLLYVIVEM